MKPWPDDFPHRRYKTVEFPELHQASAMGEHDWLRACIARGDDVNLAIGLPHGIGGEGIVPTAPFAIAAGSEWGATVETLEILLEAGANPAPPRHEASAAWTAVVGWHGRWAPGYPRRLAAALKAGAPLPTGPFGARVLTHAARESTEVLQLLLEAGMCSEMENPEIFQAPLHTAAGVGSLERVELLLAHGANPSAMVGKSNLLSVAGSVEVVELLLRLDPTLAEGVVFDECNPECPAWEAILAAAQAVGNSPDFVQMLKDATQRDLNLEGAKWLIDQGVEFDREGHTLLHSLCFIGEQQFREDDVDVEAFVRLFLDAGIDPDTRDEDGDTSLHMAIGGDGPNISAARVLVEAGADVNGRNFCAETPLHSLYVVAYGWDAEEVVEFMLSVGANPNLRNDKKESVIDLAVRTLEYALSSDRGFGQKEMHRRALRLLEQAGARFPKE